MSTRNICVRGEIRKYRCIVPLRRKCTFHIGMFDGLNCTFHIRVFDGLEVYTF